jgi:hypothetical protein
VFFFLSNIFARVFDIWRGQNNNIKMNKNIRRITWEVQEAADALLDGFQVTLNNLVIHDGYWSLCIPYNFKTWETIESVKLWSSFVISFFATIKRHLCPL